jgi:3-oxoacyl-[acyl-carrier protein] reductase
MNQSTSLAGKTALVTGAATGIGKAIAGALAAGGARVVVNHPHTPEVAAAVIADIAAAGGSALAVAADVSSRAEYQAMVERLLREYSRWDVLVNNAAVAVTKPFPEIRDDEFDCSFAVNVKGVFHATKGAVEQFTHILAKEFGPRGITVNAVSPGATETDAYRMGESERFLASLEAMSAFGRRGISPVADPWPRARTTARMVDPVTTEGSPHP